MFPRSVPVAEIRDMLYRILPMSATLAGFCVAGIGLLHAHSKAEAYAGLVDDILGLTAVIFLVCTYLAFWGLRAHSESRIIALARIIDVLFLAALTLVVVSGVAIVYAIF
jgi:hypothetical protein